MHDTLTQNAVTDANRHVLVELHVKTATEIRCWYRRQGPAMNYDRNLRGDVEFLTGFAQAGKESVQWGEYRVVVHSPV
jgi:hypothetical protein